MAEVILFTIAAQILKKLGSIALQQISSAWWIKSDLKKLEETLSTIKAVLLDAEQKQSSNHQLRLWLERLQNVLYDVDNVLDECAYEALQHQLVSRENSTRKVLHFFTHSNAIFRLTMGYKIKKIRKRLDEIALNRAQFNLTEGLIDSHVMPREMTHSFVDSSNVIGRETDKKYIVDFLTSIHNDLNLSIVPIVGIGGLGKTTLAKLVYDVFKEGVDECFQLKMWVCVSKEFTVQKVVKEIYQSATKGKIDSNLPIDVLQTELRDFLKDKKFLLVLDDVWNEDPQKWDELRQLLVNDAKGSKIIVTTRNLQVVVTMRTTQPYILKELTDEDCWSLFAKWAFREGEEKSHPKLEIIGKQIIKKCKGVALAVKSLGSMLFMKTNERDWLLVKESELWQLEENENGILTALRLSYDHLPSHLKRCFTFCSIFPKDFKFDSEKLIQMWISQGLIQSSGKNEELEEIGLRNINDLWSRGFFQDIDNAVIKMSFKMHDLVHDLALLVAKNECYTINNLPMPSIIDEKFRHVSLCITEDVPTPFEFDMRNLWTLCYFPNSRQEGANELFVRTCIPRFKFLRMLDMSYSCFEVLSKSVGSLKHLRHLKISNNIILKNLPNAICKLLHLQTLDLWGCSKLEGLPRDIGNLINLRALYITANKIYVVPDKEIGLLTSLRFLCISECPNLITSSECMKCLPELRKLTLMTCHNLESLPGIMKHLPALERLNIGNCEKLNLNVNMTDFDFSSLQVLKIWSMLQLETLPGWVQGCSTTLQYLGIFICLNFTNLPNWMPNITSLRELEIVHCFPGWRSRCKRGGEDWHKTSHIPTICINKQDIRRNYHEVRTRHLFHMFT